MITGYLGFSTIVMQLLLDYLRFSASSFTAIGKICFTRDETSTVSVRKFVSEHLNLTREVISNAKVSSGFILIMKLVNQHMFYWNSIFLL